MHSWRGALLATAALSIAASAAPQPPDVSEKATVAAAASYVASYQHLLTSVLADEIYDQTIVEQSPRDRETPRTRRMTSEIFFMFASARHDWMTIRDVVSIDRKPVQDRLDLREALRTLSADEVARTFKRHNSRYNIGRTFRNFNEPTLGLLVLDDRHRARFSFDRRRVERAGGVTLVTLAFTERDKPTLIRDPTGAPVFVKGEVIVEAGSGRVRRLQLTGKHDDIRLELTTVYSSDDHLGMFVPTRFREEYEASSRSKRLTSSRSTHERIVCDAVYTNFRRFDTSVRIR